MRCFPSPKRGLALAAALLLALTLTLTLAFVGAVTVGPIPRALAASAGSAAPDAAACDIYTPTRHIYDCAGLLTPAESSGLEARAQAVQNAGAPVVVYLQVKDTSYEQTLSDAANLMARWDVESSPGAKNGLVIMLNLKPGDLRHGQVALYAGKTLLDGALPQDELSRIYQDVMLPDLRADRTAQGIGAGLDAIAADVRAGMPVLPPPSPAQNIARTLGAIPYNVLAALLFVLALGMGLARWRRAQQEASAPLAFPSGSASALPPAVAGALITGRVGGAQMEATILDFARRGLLRIEPVSSKQAQIRLLTDGGALTGYEQRLWQALAHNAHDSVIPPKDLRNVATGWRAAVDALRSELLDQGWFDRSRSEKRQPFIILALVSGALLIVGVILGALAAQPWPFIGVALSAIAGAIALAFALSVPAVTPAGRELVQPTRAELASIRAQAPDVSVSGALPLLVAVGRANAYARRLRMESAQPANEFAAIYPYWILAHTSMAPPASSAGSVAGATGAAAGGGGAGGAF